MIKSKISAYIIAYNEQDKIEQAVKSVSWADEVIVADSFSTDATSDIAKALGAKVIQIPFQGFGDLRNQAIKACKHEWIFSLDSDERCTKQVKQEITDIINSDSSLDVYHIPRKNLFMGTQIKHSGYYPDFRQPQLFKKGTLAYTRDPVHEGFEIHTSKPVGYLKNPIWQIPFKDFEQIINKANRYSTLGAEKMEANGKKSGMSKALFHALWTFFHLFIIKMGFLDGWAGFVIAFGNFQGTFYKYAKLCEKHSKWTLVHAQSLIKDELADSSGNFYTNES
jgi:glycosyltransferase involved in cell wall biosynthesis